MSSITIDNSRPEMLMIRFDGVVDDDAFDRYLRETEEIMVRRRRESYAMVLDSRNGGRPTPAQRFRQAEFIKTHSERLKQCAGAAFVMNNAVVRGVLTALLWVQPMPYPHVVVATVEEAETWCAARLAEHAAQNQRG